MARKTNRRTGRRILLEMGFKEINNYGFSFFENYEYIIERRLVYDETIGWNIYKKDNGLKNYIGKERNLIDVLDWI